MHHRKLVQHMKDNSEQMLEGFIRNLRASGRCDELLRRVPAEEHRQYLMGTFHDMTDWLTAETDSIIEQHYVALGMRRSQLGVPFSDLFWAMSIARDLLWDYVQQECLLEEPVEFWGGLNLLRLINRFFDRAGYYALVGHQKAVKSDLARTPSAPA